MEGSHEAGPVCFLELLWHHLPEPVRAWTDPAVLHAWLVMIFLIVLGILGTRRMQDPPNASKLQLFWEWLYEVFSNFFGSFLGPRVKEFLPLLATLWLYIFFMNIMIVIPGFESPTSRLGMTAALGVYAFLYVQWVGFRELGWRYLLHFVGEPWWLFPINIPVHIISELARPVSLSMRLFGNIFAEDTVTMQFLLLSALVASYIYIPIPFHFAMLLLVLFGGFVQATVFTALTASYIQGILEEAEHHAAHGAAKP